MTNLAFKWLELTSMQKEIELGIESYADLQQRWEAFSISHEQSGVIMELEVPVRTSEFDVAYESLTNALSMVKQKIDSSQPLKRQDGNYSWLLPRLGSEGEKLQKDNIQKECTERVIAGIKNVEQIRAEKHKSGSDVGGLDGFRYGTMNPLQTEISLHLGIKQLDIRGLVRLPNTQGSEKIPAGDLANSDISQLESRTIFGLVLLTQTSQNYFRGRKESGSPSQSLYTQTLKFATEVITELKKVHENVYSIEAAKLMTGKDTCSWRIELEDFVAQGQYDFYYAAPWVAGSQMLYVWAHTLNRGNLLLRDGGYVSALLHLYNLLIVVGLLQREECPVLEALCSTFEREVFLESRPKEPGNLGSRFARALRGEKENDAQLSDRFEDITARLFPYKAIDKNFDEDVKRIGLYLADRQHRITLPGHRATCNTSVDAYTKGEDISTEPFQRSRVLNTLLSDSEIDRKTFCQMYDLEVTENNHRKAVRLFEREVSEVGDLQQSDEEKTLPAFDRLRSIGVEEFGEGKVPIVKINWFKLYFLCTQTMETYEGRAYTAPEEKSTEWPRSVTDVWKHLSFDDGLLGISKKRAKIWREKEDVYRQAKEGILKHFSADKLKPEDILWKI